MIAWVGSKMENYLFIMKRLSFTLLGVLTLLLAGCSKTDPIMLVKNGTLDFDKSVTVGNALDNYKYFSNQSWRSFVDDQKRTVVEFTALFDYNKFVGAEIEGITITDAMLTRAKAKLGELTLTYLVQFKIAADGKSFELAYSATKMTGRSKETGKLTDGDMPDKDLSPLSLIYNNKPALAPLGILISASSE